MRSSPWTIQREVETRGFAKLPGFIPASVLDGLEPLCACLLESQTVVEAQAVRSLGSLISVFQEPAFAELWAGPDILGGLASLGFEDLRFSAGFVLGKPAGGPPTYWHQDWGFWKNSISYGRRPVQASLLFYLEDVDEDKGCPRFLPGSHRSHQPLHDVLDGLDEEALRRMDDPSSAAFWAADGEVAVPMRRGDAVLFDPRVLHGAHENRSDRTRIGIALWYFFGFSDLDESIRAFVCRGHPLVDSAGDVCASATALAPRYQGNAPPAPLCKRPSLQRLRAGSVAQPAPTV